MAVFKVTPEELLRKEEELSGYCKKIEGAIETLSGDLDALQQALYCGASDEIRKRAGEYLTLGREASRALSKQIGKLKEIAASYAAAEAENVKESG